MNFEFMMNINKKTFSIFLLSAFTIIPALFYPAPLAAQEPVPVEISKEKIVVSGKVYYMHVVVKGQTLYSISRVYNVRIDQITSENEIGENGIREGQVLRIPASPATAAPGKTANASPQQERRPQTQVTSSQPAPGTVQRETVIPEPSRQDERYIYHRVRRGETLSSVAMEYGISVRDLKRANRGLLFPHEGDYLLIPRKHVSDRKYENKPVSFLDTIMLGEKVPDSLMLAEPVEIFTFPSTRTEISKLDGSVRVAILFPFFIDENNDRTYIDSSRFDSRGNKIYREVTMPATWIYEGSIPFLEAYEGILLAVDSLRTLGLSMELDVYDTGGDTTRINRLIWSGALNNADLIIGPAYSYNLEKISSWAVFHDIPVVSPVPLRDRDIVIDRPTLYRVFPSEIIAQDIMAGELKSHAESNVIFMYADTAMYNPSTQMLWNKVNRVMEQISPYDTISLTPYYFTGISSRSNAYSGVASLENFMSPDRENIVVLATTSTPVISSAFSALHSLVRKYDIKVIGYPELASLETIDLKYYYDLELFIPVTSYVDFDSPAARSFMSSFIKKFKTEPMAESFAWRGFDIALYFVGGIAMYGRDFLRDPGIFSPALLCLEPDFRRDDRNDGYENRGMYILHYRKDMTIDLKRPWPRIPMEYEEKIIDNQDIMPSSDSLVHNQVQSEGHPDLLHRR
jgi:LysM repeat protein